MQRSKYIHTKDGRSFWRIQKPTSNEHNRPDKDSTIPSNEGARSTLTKIIEEMKTDKNNFSKDFIIKGTIAAAALGQGDGTTHAKASHIQYWKEYLLKMDIDFSTFGSRTWTCKEHEISIRKRETSILSGFLFYVVTKPRKNNRLYNSCDYARNVCSTIRQYYLTMNGREIGLVNSGYDKLLTGKVIKGLSKFSPQIKQYRMPILQSHLRLIKSYLDINNKHSDRTVWALWLTQWQGVMRCGDLLRSSGCKRNA